MREIFIAIRDGDGDGTRLDPFDGSLPGKLDKVLANPTYKNTTIYFGPGLFRTRGFGALNSIALALPGQRWVGAGMNATTLQLVDAAPLTPQKPTPVAVMGGVNLDGFEICDLTLDVNLARQPKLKDTVLVWRNAPIKADGANLWGKNIRVARVRVINWGTHTSLEGFPLYIEGGPPGATGENVIEDCIIEQPDFSPCREISLLSNHARGDAPNILSTVRNCYFDGAFTTGTPPPPEPIVSMRPSGSEIEIQSQWPHGLLEGEQVLLAGCAAAVLNDRFPIRYATETSFFIPRPRLGDQKIEGGRPTAQRYVPKAMLVTLERSGKSITVRTPEEHWRKPGDWVRISGARLRDTPDLRYFNGAFQVASVPAPDRFTYRLFEEAPESAKPSPQERVWLDRWPSEMSVIPAKDGALGLRGLPAGYAWVRTAAPHFRTPGDYLPLQGLFGPLAATWNGYFKVTEVTGTRSLTCKLATQEQPADVPADSNGYYRIAAVRYNFQGMTVDVGFGSRACGNRLFGLNRSGPYHDTGTAPIREAIAYGNYVYDCAVGIFSNVLTAKDREYWNIAHDNIFELRDYLLNIKNLEMPGGILLWGPYPLDSDLLAGIYAISHAVIRDNHIRFTNGVAGGGGGPTPRSEYGISISSAKEAFLLENLVTLPLASQPLDCKHTGFATFINNLKDNGTALLSGTWPGY